MLLTGTGATVGIALINSIGSLSGWLGPSVVGWLKYLIGETSAGLSVGWLEDLTGKTATGLYVVAGLEVVATVLILLFMPRRAVTTSGTAPNRLR